MFDIEDKEEDEDEDIFVVDFDTEDEVVADNDDDEEEELFTVDSTIATSCVVLLEAFDSFHRVTILVAVLYISEI